MPRTKTSQANKDVKSSKKEIIISSESEFDEDNGCNDCTKLEKTMKKLFGDFKKELKQNMKIFEEEWKKEMKKNLRDFEDSLNFNSTKLEELVKKTSSIQNVINTMADKVEIVEKENKELKGRIKHLENNLEELQQYTRNKNIQIDNIPEIKDENLTEIMQKIGQVIKIDINKEDIDAIHRIPTKSKNNHEPIVVQFLTRQMKNEIIEKCKIKKISTEDLNIQGTKKPIFVNDHLTPLRKQILYEARQLKFEKGYKFLWTRGGKIFIRKEERSPVFQLNTLDDLTKIV